MPDNENNGFGSGVGVSTELPKVSEVPESLTYAGVVEALRDQYGVEIKKDGLSDLLNAGDNLEQLGIGGNRGRRQVSPGILPLLADFITAYREAKGTLPQAPEMLRSFLRSRRAPEVTALPAPPPALHTAATAPPVDAPEARRHGLLPLAAAWLTGRAQAAQFDEWLDAEKAALFLGVSVWTLRKYVPPSRRFGRSAAGDRWRKSDLLLTEEEGRLSRLLLSVCLAGEAVSEEPAAVEAEDAPPVPEIAAKDEEAAPELPPVEDFRENARGLGSGDGSSETGERAGETAGEVPG